MRKPDRKFITIDPENSTLKEVHNALLGGVAPRPIALVSTISEDGINNLAPFSFFNAFGANPPYVAFSPANRGRDGSTKDTFNNLRIIKECVIHAVTFKIVEQVNLASTEFQADVDEFIKSGFTAIDSDIVRPRRVKESPLHMECIVEQIIPLGGGKGSGNLVLCKVVKFHVDESVIIDGIIDPKLIDLVGRNSANFYTRASHKAIFKVSKPIGIGIGIDQLPQHIKESKILSANNLAQLGGLEKLPSRNEVLNFISIYSNSGKDVDAVINMDNYTQVYSNGISILGSDVESGKERIESAAKSALSKDDISFAVLALLSISEF